MIGLSEYLSLREVVLSFHKIILVHQWSRHESDMFVCGISLTSGQLINQLFPDCLKVMLFASCFMLQGR